MKFNIFELYSESRSMFISMLTKSASKKDRHLGQISIAKHIIKLLPNSSSVHSALYQAGLIVTNFQGLKIEKMISQNEIEPAQTEWAEQIVFAPKMTGLFASASIIGRLPT